MARMVNRPWISFIIMLTGIEDGLLRIFRVKPNRLIVVVDLYCVVCYLLIDGAFNVIPGCLDEFAMIFGVNKINNSLSHF